MLDAFLRQTAAGCLAAMFVLATAAGEALAGCPAERAQPMVASDPVLCQKLDGVVRKPSAMPLVLSRRKTTTTCVDWSVSSVAA